MMLNLNQQITSDRWAENQFKPFGQLSMDQEFDLIAPIVIYFQANLDYKQSARDAYKALMKAHHPMVEDQSMAHLMHHQPESLISRYNVLIMAIAYAQDHRVIASVNEYGTYEFAIGDIHSIISGSQAGKFALCATAEMVRTKIREVNSTSV